MDHNTCVIGNANLVRADTVKSGIRSDERPYCCICVMLEFPCKTNLLPHNQLVTGWLSQCFRDHGVHVFGMAKHLFLQL